MADTLERELRRTLADHAPDAAAPGADPWERVQRGVVRRRRQRVGALAGSLALVVALGGGLAVVRPWAGQGGTDAVATDPASGWGLDDGTPRGALAGDEALRSEVETLLRGLVPDETPPFVPGSVRLVFADDVAGTRLVVAVAEGEDGRPVAARLAGPAGTPGARLEPFAQVAAVAGTAPAVAHVVTGEEGSLLLAVVPRGAQVSVSDAARVDGAGTAVTREWRAVEVSADGLVVTPLGAVGDRGVAVLRVDAAPGHPAGSPVAELAREWPAADTEEDRLAAAAEVLERGPVVLRDGVPSPVPDADVRPLPESVDERASDVWTAMVAVGARDADSARLLYASGDGADVDRGTSGWSSLVQVRAGEGSVVRWSWHPGGNSGMVHSTVVPAPSDASGTRLLLRVSVSSEQQLVGVWDPEGTLRTVVVDGEDLVMPEALGFRWFPVAAGSEVSVDGQDVASVDHGEDVRPWPLPGEETGPAPQFSDWS